MVHSYLVAFWGLQRVVLSSCKPILYVTRTHVNPLWDPVTSPKLIHLVERPPKSTSEGILTKSGEGSFSLLNFAAFILHILNVS
jgi:hypothetical protein